MPFLPERDLEIARQIQTSFLPQSLPPLAGWEIATAFQPAREVAGDFYDVFPMVQNRRIGLVVADVCDKGVAAALFMSLCRTLIRALAQQHYSLNWTDVLTGDKVESAASGVETSRRSRRAVPSIGANALKNAVLLTNNYIAQNHGETNMFATLFFGVLDPLSGTLNYINAGHNPPLIIGPAGGVKQPLVLTGPAIGMMPDLTFEVQRAQLTPGDALLMYTDGVTEARALDQTLFGEERLLALLAQPVSGATALLDQIVGSVHAHVGQAEQADDITLLALRRLPESV